MDIKPGLAIFISYFKQDALVGHDVDLVLAPLKWTRLSTANPNRSLSLVNPPFS